MIFCGMALAPGRKVRVPLPVPGAQPLETLCLCGAAPGRTLVVTAGVHGCEYVGVQALRRLAVELDPAELSGNVILLPLANPTGFYAGAKQVVPEDGVNLNRAFPGDPAGTLSARLAYALETALYQAADFLADLHSGDCNEALYPLVFFPTAGTEAVNRAALTAAGPMVGDRGECLLRGCARPAEAPGHPARREPVPGSGGDRGGTVCGVRRRWSVASGGRAERQR